ncbi:MAG: DNA-binding NtrC family response regulator [Candidatus Latescibacterota bacterium]|jgi:DNA-binding NtrC family response regulator
MTGERILVVDDEVELALRCQQLLRSKGYEVEIATNGMEALEKMAANEPHLMITDLKMPGLSGMELLEKAKAQYADLLLVMMTAYSTVQDAVEAMRLGADDFVPKPFSPDHLLIVVQKVLSKRQLHEENRDLKKQLDQQFGFDNIIGKSPSMIAIFESMKKIADSHINVLVTGASGTGKELIARGIHSRSSRSHRPFVALNCGAIPEHLMESEIFGYERGAFTGAGKAKPGLLESAHGGTFFMDEIGELPAILQVKFLRVLQDGTFRRLGSNDEKEVDIRLVSATNQGLEGLVADGSFREDLYYRVNTFTIEIPPLRERRDDIELLASHFLQKYGEKNKKYVTSISPEALHLMLNYEWKGNVRELEHAVERALVLASGDVLQPDDLPQAILAASGSSTEPAPQVYMNLPFKDAKARLVEDFEKRYIVEVLGRHKGNISRAAIHSGIDRRSLHRLLLKHEIDASEVGRKAKEAAVVE